MSSLLLSGYLALSKGRRISSENPNTRKNTQHMYYDTVIQTSGVDIPAEIRYWVPSTEQPLVDGTVVDVLAKMYTPPNGTALLDVTQFLPFPGDPTSPKYEDSIPERPFPTVIVLGHTAGAVETMDDGVSVGYSVQCTDYIRDQNRSSRVYCKFDASKPRWKKTPRPSQGTSVYVVGLAHGVHLDSGTLMVDVDQLHLNVGSSGPSAQASAPRAETGGPPAKRRRFPTSAAAKPDAESSNSTPKEDSLADGIPLDLEAQEAPGATGVPDAVSGKKKTAGARRKVAQRREENDEGEG